MHHALIIAGFAAGSAMLAFMALIVLWVRASSKELRRQCAEAEARIAAAAKTEVNEDVRRRARIFVSNQEYDLGSSFTRLKDELGVPAVN